VARATRFVAGTCEIIDIFKRLGLSVAEGPEIEDDWLNFSAPTSHKHPARYAGLPSFIKKTPVETTSLCAHTSSVQLHYDGEWQTTVPPLCRVVFIVMRLSLHVHCHFFIG